MKTRLFDRLGSFVLRHPFLYYILTFTWGLLMTLLGLLVMMSLFIFRRGNIRLEGYHVYFEFKKDKQWGFSVGMISFIGRIREHQDKEVLYHEFGHTVQNAILGPLVIFLVYIPSLLRYHYREWLYKHDKPVKTAYDDIWFEDSATTLGIYWREDYLWKENKRRKK